MFSICLWASVAQLKSNATLNCELNITGSRVIKVLCLCFCGCRLHENFELLKGRLMSITENKSQLDVDIKRKTQHNRALISEMNSLKPEMKRLGIQRDQLKK